MGMLSFKKAKDFSLQKFKWYAENPMLQEESATEYLNRFKRANPKLKELLSNCGFCERYIKTPLPCFRCELGIVAGKCREEEDALYSLWFGAVCYGQIEKSTELAKKMLETIQNLKSEV